MIGVAGIVFYGEQTKKKKFVIIIHI